jgi:hypothetical protein|tara:strand:+ start:274 stop:486 length:213 start_codon:yes stop_codon:yes gene_type:complete
MAAPDKKISELPSNFNINGTEQIPTERGGSNYKNNYNQLKAWLGVGDKNIDGGTPTSIFTEFQFIDGGNP